MPEWLGQLDLHTQATLWTAALAIIASASCALVGCYLVLRRMGLLGDAISHAVLPGLAVGFILSGSRELWPMLIGAVLAGLLTTFLSEILRRRVRVEAGAAMGVVFTSLFALGVILINVYARQVDLDPGCVLYGSLGTVALDTQEMFGMEVPRSFLPLTIVFAADLGLILLFWKELKIASFDPALATTLGVSAGLMHYLLMTLVSVTTVACFEAVGSILVIAMLIVPGAIAHLMTDKLWKMLVIAVLASTLAAGLGIWLAEVWNTSEAGMMAVAAGALFAAAVFFAPRHGIVAKGVRRMLLALRIEEDDLLGYLYRVLEKGGAASAALRLPAWQRNSQRLAFWSLRLRGTIRSTRTGIELGPSGIRRAQHLVRSHRLWESYLAKRLGLPTDHLHDPAHRMEHFVTPELAAALTERLQAPVTDPHGRDIPPDWTAPPREVEREA